MNDDKKELNGLDETPRKIRLKQHNGGKEKVLFLKGSIYAVIKLKRKYLKHLFSQLFRSILYYHSLE